MILTLLPAHRCTLHRCMVSMCAASCDCFLSSRAGHQWRSPGGRRWSSQLPTAGLLQPRSKLHRRSEANSRVSSQIALTARRSAKAPTLAAFPHLQMRRLRCGRSQCRCRDSGQSASGQHSGGVTMRSGRRREGQQQQQPSSSSSGGVPQETWRCSRPELSSSRRRRLHASGASAIQPSGSDASSRSSGTQGTAREPAQRAAGRPHRLHSPPRDGRRQHSRCSYRRHHVHPPPPGSRGPRLRGCRLQPPSMPLPPARVPACLRHQRHPPAQRLGPAAPMQRWRSCVRAPSRLST